MITTVHIPIHISNSYRSSPFFQTSRNTRASLTSSARLSPPLTPLTSSHPSRLLPKPLDISRILSRHLELLSELRLVSTPRVLSQIRLPSILPGSSVLPGSRPSFRARVRPPELRPSSRASVHTAGLRPSSRVTPILWTSVRPPDLLPALRPTSNSPAGSPSVSLSKPKSNIT